MFTELILMLAYILYFYIAFLISKYNHCLLGLNKLELLIFTSIFKKVRKNVREKREIERRVKNVDVDSNSNVSIY